MKWALVPFVCLAACAASAPSQRETDGEDDAEAEEATGDEATGDEAEAAAAAVALAERNEAFLALDVPPPPKLPMVPGPEDDPYNMRARPGGQGPSEDDERPPAEIRVSIVQLTPSGARTEIAFSGAKLAVGMKGFLAHGGKRTSFAIARVEGGTAYATVAVPVAELRGVKSAVVRRNH